MASGRSSSFVVYALGKTTTYGLLGLVIGLAGSLISSALADFQSIVAIVAGIVMIVVGLSVAGMFSWLSIGAPRWAAIFTSFLSEGFGKAATSKRLSSRFVFGMINGLLPCGLVYGALAYSAALASPETSALFMMAFGLGTIPALILVATLWNRAPDSFRALMTRTAGWFLVIFGIWTVARSVSPMMHQAGM